MSALTLLRVALQVVSRNKMRAALTVLGIVIGVGAVIAMVGLGKGASSRIQNQIASLGSNLLIIMPGAIQSGGVRSAAGSASTLTMSDIEAILREVPTVAEVAPTNRTPAQVVSGDANWSTLVVGSTPAFFTVREWEVARGAVHTDTDELSAAKVCVIGKTVQANLFGGLDPIGQTVRIKKVPFRVIGALASKGQSAMGSDQDDTIVVPFATFAQRLGGGQRNLVMSAFASARSADDANKAVAEVSTLLRQRHRIGEGDEDDFSIRNFQDVAKASEEVMRVLSLLLGSIASVSLLVGGIGIMNIMLVSVTERTREIGIRMAVGARPWDILMQFLVEAIVLSGIGGVLGVGMGYVASRVLANVMEWPTVFDVESATLAFAVSAAIGVIFGLYPARRASKLDPVEALRFE